MNPVNRIRAIQTCRNWNEAFKPGTLVIFEGREAFTDSPAALGAKDDPSVFLKGIDAAVPLDRLQVPGWEFTTKRRKGAPPHVT